jgi:hypothetical protein
MTKATVPVFLTLLFSLCPRLLYAQERENAVRCQAAIAFPGDNVDLCSENGCFWLEAKEQDGTDTGRCYRCSQQASESGCVGTGDCLWIDGRKELGGSDCTICAGREQQDCESSTSSCFWNLPGYEGVCSKCPGHTDSDSCSNAGCFWRKIQGVERCVKCGGFVTQETCEAAACTWNPDATNVKCGGNPKIFLLPEEGSKTSEASSIYSPFHLIVSSLAWSLLMTYV